MSGHHTEEEGLHEPYRDDPSETERLLGHHHPPPPPPPPRWQTNRRRLLCKRLGFTLIVAILVLFVVLFALFDFPIPSRSRSIQAHKPPSEYHNVSQHGVAGAGGSYGPDFGQQQRFHYEFAKNVDYISFIEERGSTTDKNEVRGKVIFVPSGEDDLFTIDLDIRTSPPEMLKDIEFQSYEWGVLSFWPNPPKYQDCIAEVTATIGVPRRKQGGFYLRLRNLDIHTGGISGISLGKMVLRTDFGNIHGGKDEKDLFEATEIQAISERGDIGGIYSLRHNASFVTDSGSINVGLLPVALNGTGPPGGGNSSGDGIPHSDSLWPPNIDGFTLFTKTSTGHTNVEYRVNLNGQDLISTHVSTALLGGGNVHVQLPSDFAGTMQLGTGRSGNIKVSGDDLDVVYKRNGWFSKEWWVLKGEGDSGTFVSTWNGNINIEA